MPKIINGRYLLHEKLGEGGMGIVYRTTDKLTRDVVALKMVTTEAAENDEAFRLALAHEFQILAGLRHPHIISVLDYGFDGEKRPFFTMTYLPQRQTILEAAEDRPFGRKVELIQQLLQALAYLHRRGVLHRDIKPDNVLVIDGSVRVLDLGMSTSDQNSGIVSVGTPLYMARELFYKGGYSETTDLYAVGVLFHQLLTNEHPFAPFDFKFIDRVLNEEPNLDKLRVSAELIQVICRLLAKEPADRYQSAHKCLNALNIALGQQTLVESEAIRDSYLQAAKFVGREQEMTRLTNALDQAKTGRGTAWLIGGESGVGKTRLLTELRTAALVKGFQVLYGQGVEGSGGLPYQLWRAPVRHLIASSPEISPLISSVLQPLIPDIDKLLAKDIQPASELEGDAARIRLFTTILQLFKQSERPLLLILEDLHWTEGSLQLLPFFMRTIENQKLLILGSYRNDERPTLANELPQMSHFSLERLTMEALSDLSASMLGDVGRDEAVQTLLMQETEGNTFFAVEIVRSLAEEAGRLENIDWLTLQKKILPNGIHDIVQRRLQRLPEKAKALLIKAAIVGREIEIPLVIALNQGLDVENEWLPLCADAAVLDVQNGVWQFSHGKIRDELLANLTQTEHLRLHQEVAETIEHQWPEDEGRAIQLAYHWREANNREKAVGYSIVAAETSVKRYANQDAISHFTHALELISPTDLTQRYQLLLSRSKLYGWTGDTDSQQIDLVQLLELATASGNLAYQANAYLEQASYEQAIGRPSKALDASAQTLEIANQIPSAQSIFARAFAQQAISLLRIGRYDDAKNVLDQSFTLYDALGDLTGVAKCYRYEGMISWYKGYYQDAFDCFTQGLRIARELGDELSEANFLNTLGATTDNLGDYEIAQRYYEESLFLFQKIGFRLGQGKALHNLGTVLDNQGLYHQANSYYEKSLDICRATDNQWGVGLSLSYLGRNAWYVGEYDRAEHFLLEALVVQNATQDKLETSTTLNLLGMVAFQKNLFEKAYDYYCQSLTLRRELGNSFGIAQTLNNLGYWHFAQGDLSKAEEQFQQALQLHQEMGQAHLVIEDQVGLVRLRLAKGTYLVEALAPIIAQIEKDPQLMGTVRPFAAYLTCYKVLEEIFPQKAFRILHQAYEVLQERASHIDDAEIRHHFLMNVADHQELLELYERSQTAVFHQADEIMDEITETINGRYIVHRKIGEGGMGVVYLATDRLTQQQVALKKINVDLDNLDWLTSKSLSILPQIALTREFQILASLRHPNIISVREYGFDDVNDPFYTMDHLENAQTILDASQSLQFNEKIHLIQQMLQALVYLHRRGVLHRDIKPNNVLVANNFVRLVDFGLASYKGQNGSSGGTLIYMSPEMFIKEGSQFVEATDLYSVGVIMYEMITDTHPFDITSEDFVNQVLTLPPDLNKLNPYGAIKNIIGKLLAKQPEERYQKADECLRAVNEAIGQPLNKDPENIRNSFIQAAAFVGREAELAQLEDVLNKSQRGSGSVCLIGGESGVGKTRFIDEIRTSALVLGWHVLIGQAVSGGRLPYQLWRDIVPSLLLNVELNDLEAGVLRQIVPDIERLLERKIPPVIELNGLASQQRLTLTLTRVIQRYPHPLLLLLEDLQWAQEGLAPLRQILEVIKQLSSVVIFATYRHDEAPRLPDTLAGSTVLPLERLRKPEIEKLCLAILGRDRTNDQLIDLLTQETEGNIFFIVEVMRALAEEAGNIDEIGQMTLPEGVFTQGMHYLLSRRIQRVNDSDQSISQLMAVAGRMIDLSLLHSLMPDQNIEQWLDRTSQASIVSVRDGRWQFAHDKLREVILANLTEESKRSYHRRLAEAIEKVYPDDRSYHRALFEHWHYAGYVDEAIQYLLLVTRHLIQITAEYDDALLILNQGLGTLPKADSRRVALWNLQTRLLIYRSEYSEALEVAKQAEALARKTQDNHGVADCLTNTGLALLYQGDYKLAAQAFLESQELAEELGDKKIVAKNLSNLLRVAKEQGYHAQAIDYYKRSMALFEEIDDKHNLAIILMDFAANNLSNNPTEARKHLQQSLAILQEIGDQRNIAACLSRLGVCERNLKSYEQAIGYLQQAMLIAESIGDQIYVSTVLNNLGRVAYLQGNYSQALSYGEQSYAIRKATGFKYGLVFSLLIRGFSSLRLEIKEAKELLREALEIAQAIQARPLMEASVAGFAWLYYQEGDFEYAAKLTCVVQWLDAELWLEDLYPLLEASLGSEQLKKKLELGKTLDLDKIVNLLINK